MRYRIGKDIAMAWSMEGQLFETCNCDLICPCSAYPFSGADYDRCLTVYGFRFDTGQIEGVDIAGTLMVLAWDIPKYFRDGNWRVGLLVDAAASDEQAAKLTAFFSGKLGGPVAALSGFIGENLGVQRVPLQYSVQSGTRVLTVGNLGRLAITELVPSGEKNGSPVRMTAKFNPATAAGLSDGQITMCKAETGSHLDAFGIEYRPQVGLWAHFCLAG
jgi:hypothetical protein